MTIESHKLNKEYTFVKGNKVTTYTNASTEFNLGKNNSHTRMICSPVCIPLEEGRYTLTLGTYNGTGTYYAGLDVFVDSSPDLGLTNWIVTDDTNVNVMWTGTARRTLTSGWVSDLYDFELPKNGYLILTFKIGDAGTTSVTSTHLNRIRNNVRILRR